MNEIEIVSYKPHVRRKKVPRRHASAKVRQVPLSKLKKALESLQKQLVIQTYGNDCFTCSAKDLQGSNCQLGHVPWPRSILSVQAKFDIRYTRIQDFGCNINRGGMGAMALKRMQDEGIDTSELWRESVEQKGKTVPRIWFEEKIKLYTVLLEKDKSMV